MNCKVENRSLQCTGVACHPSLIWPLTLEVKDSPCSELHTTIAEGGEQYLFIGAAGEKATLEHQATDGQVLL